jgi:hypothetical protein
MVALTSMKNLLLHTQMERPYRAWRWLVGSNPPRFFAA